MNSVNWMEGCRAVLFLSKMQCKMSVLHGAVMLDCFMIN